MSRFGDALINRDYAKLWSGQAVSTIGDAVFDTTLVLWVATRLGRGQSWAPAAVGGVLLAAGAAILTVGPLAGVFVDRWNRQRTMLRTETVRAILVGALAVLAFLPMHTLPVGVWLAVIYLVVFLVNVAGQFFNPARFATIGEIVPGEADRAKAAGIGQATMATASIVGPPLAAPLLFTVGMQWALVLNAASYVVSFIAIRSIRLDERKAASGDGPDFRKEFVEGLRFFRTNRFIVTLLTVAVIVQSGTGAWETLDVFFVTGNLHSPARLFGFISMAMGIGSIVGALWSSRVVQRFGARGTLWGMLLVSGFLIMAYSRQTHFPAAFVLVVAIAIPIAMVNTSISPLVLRVVPQELLGRTMAVFNPINQLSSMLSTVAAGWLMSTVMLGFHADVGGLHLGPIDTIFSAVALLFIFAAGYGFLRLPRLEKPSPASEADDSGAQTPTGSSFSLPPR